MRYSYDRRAMGATGQPLSRRLQDVQNDYLREVAAELGEVLMDEGVTIRKRGDNYVEGTSSAGARVQVVVMLKNWIGIEGTVTRDRVSKVVKLNALSFAPRDVANQVVYKSGLF